MRYKTGGGKEGNMSTTGRVVYFTVGVVLIALGVLQLALNIMGS